MSKDQLIDKLLSYQLNKYIQKIDSDLNVSEGKDGDDAVGRRNMDWFKINIGKADHITIKEFLDFVMDVTRLTGRDFGDIIIKKEHTFFQVDKTSSSKIPAFFEGIMVDEKELLVKKEEPHINDIQTKQKGKKDKGNFGGRRGRSHDRGDRGGDRRKSYRGR